MLERIHDRGVLHRDVKPSNIGYTGDGVVKLLDFGLAQVLEDSLHASAHGLERGRAEMRAREISGPESTLVSDGLVGTPLYMSPEALWGQPPDRSFDLWSAAVVLFEAIAGRNPFQRASWPETFQAITNVRASDLDQPAHECPPELSALLVACLSRDRQQRPGSARDLGRRLRDVGAG